MDGIKLSCLDNNSCKICMKIFWLTVTGWEFAGTQYDCHILQDQLSPPCIELSNKTDSFTVRCIFKYLMAVISLETSHFKLIPMRFVAEDMHPVHSVPGRLYCLACLFLSFEARFCFSPDRCVWCVCIFLLYQFGLVKDWTSLHHFVFFLYKERGSLFSTNANLCIKH